MGLRGSFPGDKRWLSGRQEQRATGSKRASVDRPNLIFVPDRARASTPRQHHDPVYCGLRGNDGYGATLRLCHLRQYSGRSRDGNVTSLCQSVPALSGTTLGWSQTKGTVCDNVQGPNIGFTLTQFAIFEYHSIQNVYGLPNLGNTSFFHVSPSVAGYR